MTATTKTTANHADIFITADGAVELTVRRDDDTVWLSIDQMVTLFARNKSTISRHISNIFAEGELERSATVANFATVQTEGNRAVEWNIEYYNLDVIISAGYRYRPTKCVS